MFCLCKKVFVLKNKLKSLFQKVFRRPQVRFELGCSSLKFSTEIKVFVTVWYDTTNGLLQSSLLRLPREPLALLYFESMYVLTMNTKKAKDCRQQGWTVLVRFVDLFDSKPKKLVDTGINEWIDRTFERHYSNSFRDFQKNHNFQ
jgi:hypothetical protein